MNLIILLLLTVFALLHAPQIYALKRIKRNAEVKLRNSIKDDFVMLKNDNQDNQHVVGGGDAGFRKIEQRDSSLGSNDNNLKANKTKGNNRPLTLIMQGKDAPVISNSRQDHNLPISRKLIMRQSNHPSQFMQHLYQSNDDPILDFIFNSMEAPKSLYGNTNLDKIQKDNPFDDAQTRTIIYAPPAFFKQPLSYKQPKQEIESLMENALNSLLMDESQNMNDDSADGGSLVDYRCPVHQGKRRGGKKGNEKRQKDGLNDADVIQYCSCHFIKKSKGGDVKDTK